MWDPFDKDDCFNVLVGNVLVWRNGVLPLHWSGAYHPGHFQRTTGDHLRRCLVWLDARGFQQLSARLQGAYDDVLKCVGDLDARYAKHPAPADATESQAIVGDQLLPCYDKTAAFADLVEEMKREVVSMSQPSGPVRAGAAYLAAMELDPKAKAAWERARAKLQAYAEVLRDADAGSADELRRRLDDMAETIREGLRASGDELAAQGFVPPATIEDWEHLVRIVEIPLETIRSGNLTAREIHACALAWADRQRLKGKLAASANAPTSTKPPAPDATAEAEDAGDLGGPTEDPHDNRVAWWAGKRIYLGNDTEVSRLFWLLAKPVGAAANLAQVQRAIDGMETTRDMRPDDVKKAAQRLRKIISKLRAALREAGLDDHVLIVKDGPQAEPQYSMVPRFGK